MVYLAIMVLVAVAGITRLYMQQRRERLSVEKADSFWAGLERIAVHPDPRATAPIKRRERTPRTKKIAGRPRAAAGIDPARRAAAKRRIEQRRRIVAQRAAARRAAAARRQAAARAQAARRAAGRSTVRRTPAARRSAARNGAPRQQQRQARVPDAYEVPPVRRDLQPGRLAKEPARSAGSPPAARRRVATPPLRKKHVEPPPRPVSIPDSSGLPRIMVRNVEPRRIDIDDRHGDWIDLREATSGRYVR